MMKELEIEAVSRSIADLLEQRMGGDAGLLLAGAPFLEIYENFDSLSVLELQTLIEEKYGVTIDFQSSGEGSRLPLNIPELASAVVAHHKALRSADSGDLSTPGRA